MGEFQRWNTHHSHIVPIEVCGHRLSIAQEPTSDNLGTTIWDASVILVRYMERNPQLYSRRKLEGKRVLELGAGCGGLAGLFFALQGAHVTFTDLIEVVPLLQRNVTMNLGGQAAEPLQDASSGGARGKGGSKVTVAPARPKAKVLEYDWGKPLDGLSPPYDYVIACDCVYVERLVEPLVWSMAKCSGRTTTVLVASEKREEVTYAKFRERLSADFVVRQAPRRHMDKAYDHENSEVLVCRLRKTTGGGSSSSSSSSSSNGTSSGGGAKGGGGDCKDQQPEEKNGDKNNWDVCLVGEGEASAEAAGAGRIMDSAEDHIADGGGAEVPCTGNGKEVTAPAAATTARTTAPNDADGLSLVGVSLSSSSSTPCENVTLDRSSGPTEKVLLEANGGGDPLLR